MTSPTEPGTPDSVEYATTASVSGLAREVEALRRGVGVLQQLPRRVEEVAGLVTRLAERTAAAAGAKTESTVTWLDFPEQPPQSAAGAVDAELMLAQLAAWVGGVYLRYTDAARSFPVCWLWHPDVVEELCWLRQAWLAAYTIEDVPVSAAADWHDRLRPGVVRRVKDYAGMCSIEAHQVDGDRHHPAPAAPLTDAAGVIAQWWTGHRAAPPPVPTPDHTARAGSHGRPARAGRR
jgi:hypothetical protein